MPTRARGRDGRRIRPLQCGDCHNLEIATAEPAERVQRGVIPAGAGGTGDVPGGPVVGEDHAVALERGGDEAGLHGQPGDVDRPFQPDPQAHWRRIRQAAGARLMAGGIDVAGRRTRSGEAQGVADRSRPHLAVASQAGEDGQPRGVGRGPAGRAQMIGAQVKDRARARGPRLAAGGRVGVVELVVGARRAVDDDHVTIAGRPRPALDRHVMGQRVGAVVGLARIGESHRDLARAARDDGIGDPVRRAVVHRAEVRVHGVRQPDAGDDLRRVPGHRQPVHALVPRVVGWEHGAPRQGRRRGSAARKRWDEEQQREGQEKEVTTHAVITVMVGGATTARMSSSATAHESHPRRAPLPDPRAGVALLRALRRRRASHQAARRTRPRRRSRCSHRRPEAGGHARRPSGLAGTPTWRSRGPGDGGRGGPAWTGLAR